MTAIHRWLRCPVCGVADDQQVTCPACGSSMRVLQPTEDWKLARLDQVAAQLGGSELWLRLLRQVAIESCPLS